MSCKWKINYQGTELVKYLWFYVLEQAMQKICVSASSKLTEGELGMPHELRTIN
jgi:hypothetical protein